MALHASRLRFGWVLAPALVAALYLPGLAGGLVLDDHSNLAPIEGYLRGELDWRAVVSGNESGPLGRPIAMASLLLNAAVGGLDPFGFKLVNLLLHLVCAGLAAQLTRAVLAAAPAGRESADTLALAVGLTWALLPIQVGTVLYVVQRMAILSALFTLAALCLYVAARQRMIAGRSGGAPLLWLAVPAATIAATLSKENGVLVPALALVVEYACFGRATAPRRDGTRAWFVCFLLVPLVLGALALALWPERFFGGYASRPFTLYERLLTGPRVLWEYVAAVLLPTSARVGLMQDDFQASRDWLAPPGTSLAALAWLAVLGAGGWLARRGRPLLLTGLLFFLVGHALEAGIFPLELYFPHRNYLPALGLLWVAVGLGLELKSLARNDPLRFALPVAVCVAGALVAYTLGTHRESLLWSNKEDLLRQAVASHPGSERAHAELGALLSHAGQADAAAAELRAAAGLNPDNAGAYALAEMLADCIGDRATDPAVDRRARHAQGGISLPAVAVYARISERIERNECPRLDAARVIAIGAVWLQHHGGWGQAWQIHYRMARLQSARGEFRAALPHALVAWRGSGREPRVGLLAFQLYATLGDLAGCRRQLAELRAADRGGDRVVRAAFDQFQAYVDTASPH